MSITHIIKHYTLKRAYFTVSRVSSVLDSDESVKAAVNCVIALLLQNYYIWSLCGSFDRRLSAQSRGIHLRLAITVSVSDLQQLLLHVCFRFGGWWRWALVSLDGVAPSWMVGVSASVNLPLHHKVQKFSSGIGWPGWSRKKGHKTVVVVVVFLIWNVCIIWPHHRLSQYYVDAAYCYRWSSMVCLSDCLSVTIMSPAKSAKLIKMSFGMWTRVGPSNHLLDGGPAPPCHGTILRGEGRLL